MEHRNTNNTPSVLDARVFDNVRLTPEETRKILEQLTCALIQEDEGTGGVLANFMRLNIMTANLWQLNELMVDHVIVMAGDKVFIKEYLGSYRLFKSVLNWYLDRDVGKADIAEFIRIEDKIDGTLKTLNISI